MTVTRLFSVHFWIVIINKIIIDVLGARIETPMYITDCDRWMLVWWRMGGNLSTPEKIKILRSVLYRVPGLVCPGMPGVYRALRLRKKLDPVYNFVTGS